MGKILLVCRLAVRDLRRRRTEAVLLLLAITAATATLTLGLALHGTTSQPYRQTRAATAGPDVVAELGGTRQVDASRRILAQAQALTDAHGVTGHSGPYPVASVVLRAHGLTAGAEAEGRGSGPASIEQPKLTQGSWVRPGGVVVERTFAAALGIHTGDRITLDGRPYRVAGIAVTAASTPYPNLCYAICGFTLTSAHLKAINAGMIWVTQADARSLATPAAPLFYLLNLRLRDPAVAASFAGAYDNAHPASTAPSLVSWQTIRAGDGLLVADEQNVLNAGSWLLVLLALASVAVLVGGRMAEQTRRVGLLKATGGTPGLVAAVLLAENLALALVAAAAGLAAGWLAAPLLTNPGAGLIGTAGAPSLTLSMVEMVTVVAVAVAMAATLVPAIRAARTSTVSALADAARAPRRRAALIAVSRRLPVPLLLGLRLAARRPRRLVLNAASVAITVTGIVAVLTFRVTSGQQSMGGRRGLGNPVFDRDSQVILILTVILLVLAALNAIFTTWATALDARRPSALARALGVTPRQLAAGLSAAQLLPALPGAVLGIPAGIGLFAVANSGGAAVVTIPSAWSLAAAGLGTLLVLTGLVTIPARIGARRPIAEILQAGTA